MSIDLISHLEPLVYEWRRPKDLEHWPGRVRVLQVCYPMTACSTQSPYLLAVQRGWEASARIEGRSDAIAATYAALKHPSTLAYVTEASLLLSRPDTVAARKSVDNGLALDPNDPDLHTTAALVEAGLGNHKRSVEFAERSLRLDPRHPASYLSNFGKVRHVAGDTEAALALYNRALDRNSEDWSSRIRRAAAFAELGRTKDAAEDLQIARKSWPKSWGARQFIAPVLAWYWGRAFGEAYIERLEKAFVDAGLPSVPEGFDLQPENRLDLAAVKTLLGADVRQIGRCCGGEWMSDYFANGKRVEYWNGAKIRTSSRVFLANGAVEIRRHDRLAQNRFCEIYRNPSGSNSNLDAYIAACAHNIVTFGVFPLP